MTSLSLSFDNIMHLSKAQQQTLSTCLLSFQNLEYLQLSLEFQQVFIDDKQICLIEFYKKSLNLKSLDISVGYLKTKTYFLNLLLHGIRYLEQLRSFSFQITFSKQQAAYILDILEDELKQNSNLTELNIDLGYKILISNDCFCQISRILKNLKNLQKLDLKINYYQKQITQKSQPLIAEMYIYNLPHLKNLTLNLDYISVSECNFILKALSKINNLEQVSFDFLIESSQQNQSQDQAEINDIQSLGDQICKFVNIESLKFKFSYFFDIKFHEVINFISIFNCLKKLKILKIDIPNIKDFSQIDQLNVNKFFEVIKQLSKIYIKIRFDSSYFANSFYPNILTKSISYSVKIEELYLDIYDFSQTQIKPQQLQFQDFAQNKFNLKDLNINLGNFIEIEESSVFNFFSAIKKNKNLKNLNFDFLNNSNLSKKTLEELSDSLTNLKQLNQLSIKFFNYYGSVDDQGFYKLINTFRNLNSLTELQIKIIKDQFSSQTIKCLLGIFKNLENLSLLSIHIYGQHFLNDEEEADFGSSFEFPQKIDVIDISLDISRIKWKNFENMFLKISQLKRIEQLQINFKSFQIQKQESILLKQYFSKLKLIKYIYLEGYSFSILHLVLLFQEIQSLSYIQFEQTFNEENYCLVLAKRKFLVNQLHVANDLTNLQQLQSLSQNSPQIVTLKIQSDQLLTNYETQNSQDQNLISFVFESLKFLTTLEFEISHNNQLGENNSQLIFKNLSNLKFLKKLIVVTQKENSIGNESVKLFGQSLLQLQCLEVLSFVLNEQGNNLEWQKLYFFLECLGMLKQLKSLTIKLIFKKQFEENIKLKFASEFFRQVANLDILNDLSIRFKNFNIQTDFLTDFNYLCNKLSTNLKNLTLYFDQQQDQTIKQISRSLLLLQNLQIISISLKSKLIEKLKRVVLIKKVYDDYQFD